MHVLYIYYIYITKEKKRPGKTLFDSNISARVGSSSGKNKWQVTKLICSVTDVNCDVQICSNYIPPPPAPPHPPPPPLHTHTLSTYIYMGMCACVCVCVRVRVCVCVHVRVHTCVMCVCSGCVRVYSRVLIGNCAHCVG